MKGQPMSTVLVCEAPPIRIDDTDSWRVGESRVLVELVIDAFRDGETPEQIAQDYNSATLADIYGVIAYALRHPAEIDAYLARRKRQAEEVRRKIEARQGDLSDIRNRLAARRRELKDADVAHPG
jgi:uncharacterized protein (DUF433 family)